MFRAAGREVAVAGNVGRALMRASRLGPDAWIVCELSSFQLEDVHELRPRVAVLINLEPDHLDRHGTFEAYREAKLRIFEQADSRRTRPSSRAGSVPCRAVRGESRSPPTTCCPAEPGLPGAAQPRERRRGDRGRPRGRHLRRARSPRRCATSRASSTGSSSSPSWAASVRQRLEGDEHGRRPPGPRRVRRAAARDPRRLAQGRVVRRARAGSYAGRAYLIGETADELADALDRAGVPYERCGDLAAAVAAAAAAARPGEVVLLSPGVRELRPVPRLRAARRGVPQARAEPVRVKRGHIEANVLVLVTLALVAFGMVMVYSATSASAAIGGGNPAYYLKRQGIYAAARARAPASIASRWSYRSLRHFAPVLVLGSLVPARARARRGQQRSTARAGGSTSAARPSSRPSWRSSRSAVWIGALPGPAAGPADARRAVQADRAADGDLLARSSSPSPTSGR